MSFSHNKTQYKEYDPVDLGKKNELVVQQVTPDDIADVTSFYNQIVGSSLTVDVEEQESSKKSSQLKEISDAKLFLSEKGKDFAVQIRMVFPKLFPAQRTPTISLSKEYFKPLERSMIEQPLSDLLAYAEHFKIFPDEIVTQMRSAFNESKSHHSIVEVRNALVQGVESHVKICNISSAKKVKEEMRKDFLDVIDMKSEKVKAAAQEWMKEEF